MRVISPFPPNRSSVANKLHVLFRFRPNSFSAMVTPADLCSVDWSKLPVPEDDGAAAHLTGMAIPPQISLPGTDGKAYSLGGLPGRSVLFAYPRNGTPLLPPSEWDAIPGARGCTPHSCAFRNLAGQFKATGVQNLFGLSTQDTAFQRELVELAHLPYPILSDEHLELAKALRLPTMVVSGETMIKRLALVIDGGVIRKVFYPVFPPDKNASDVLEWLRRERN